MRIGPNIYKRRDGRWEARVVIGKKANGKPQYKYLYAPTERFSENSLFYDPCIRKAEAPVPDSRG